LYKFDQIKSIHLEVTSKCQARCPMCPRRIHGGPEIDGLYLDEITYETFCDWFSLGFVKQLEHLYMCGNLGDPIIAKDTVKIFEYLRAWNPEMSLQMHTNGSGRNKQWWTRLAELDVKVVFGIDGLEDTHKLYRVNTDWNKIIENAQTFIQAGGEARWDMLVFEHNQHQVDDCKEMSESLGFKSFTVKHTTRFKNGKFDVVDDNYNVTHTLYPSEQSKQMIEPALQAQNDTLPKINCKAKQDNSLYIAANGNISPCCWLDFDWMPQHSNSKIDYMIKVKEIPNLHRNTMQEVFSSNYFNKIESTWTTCGMAECSKQCGNFDKLNMQFERN